MLDNFKSNSEKEFAVKLSKDGTETPFRFEYSDDPTQTPEMFLSNLKMTSEVLRIKVSKNLNWTINDVVLVGTDRTRYQVSSVQKIRRQMTKNMFVHKVEFNYILELSA